MKRAFRLSRAPNRPSSLLLDQSPRWLSPSPKAWPRGHRLLPPRSSRPRSSTANRERHRWDDKRKQKHCCICCWSCGSLSHTQSHKLDWRFHKRVHVTVTLNCYLFLMTERKMLGGFSKRKWNCLVWDFSRKVQNTLLVILFAAIVSRSRRHKDLLYTVLSRNVRGWPLIFLHSLPLS